MSRFFLPLALLALLTLQPLRGWAAEADPRIQLAEERVEAWRLAEAREILAALLGENPRSAEALDLSARVQFYQGRYEEALKLYEQALAIDAKNDRRQALRLFAQRTLDTLKKLKRFESEHFIVYLDEERDGILLPYVLDALEKSYRSIARALGHAPASKVRVEIAPDVASFNAISTLSLRDIEETGAVGICKFNKIMTISPRVLLQGYRWLDSLSHEYLHYAIVPLSDNKAPIWLHEGMARFYETLWRRAATAAMREDYLSPANRTLLAQALEKDKFVGFKKMEPSLIYLETPEQVQLAYAEAASVIDFLIQRKGEAGVRNLLSELRSRPTPEAIEKVVGLPFPAFETEWKRFLRAKGLKEIEGTRVRRYKVKESPKVDEESVELREIQSVVARNRTHLADQMLERGRGQAAVQEYRRALQASPHSPIILNKLARLLIQQAKYPEALPHLQRARDLDPDSGNTLVQLGRLYHGTKNFSAGKAALEEAIQINPFNPEIYRLLQDIYSALGDGARAKSARATLERLGRMR